MGPHVVAGEVNWYVNGERLHNPANQLSYAARLWRGGCARTSAAGRRRKQLRPVIDEGAIVMDRIFDTRRVSHSGSHPTGLRKAERPGPELR